VNAALTSARTTASSVTSTAALVASTASSTTATISNVVVTAAVPWRRITAAKLSTTVSVTTTSAPVSRDRRFDGFLVVAAMAALMWLSEVVDTILGGDLDGYGIRPHDPDRLIGIATAPFLHAGFGHLLSNTVPFLALGCAIALNGAARVLAVTAIVMLVGGLGTWLVAPESSVHIGASGVVFGYAAYLISRGAFNRSAPELAIGALVAAIWGSALVSGLLPRDGISWQGHLFGALGGIAAAAALRRERA
jgi:membrane associated rhomboid family serine protease